MINRVLITNRSEIALRVTRTTCDIGVKSTTVYLGSDRDAQFVREADEAYALVGTAYADMYMNTERLLEIARKTRADTVHPGYGFLSKTPGFVRAMLEADVAWIGPSPEVLGALGDKIRARRLAKSVDVSPVAELSDLVTGRDIVDAFVAENGSPIVTKKVDGGGGRGITVVESDSDLDVFFTAHGHHAEGFFVKYFVRTAWHVETQRARDSFGNFVIVSTRDCPVQRRDQKLIEEASTPVLPRGVEETLVDWSRRLFDAVGYEGLGACKFLVEADGRVNFLEVSPRLQVEHTVSEETTGPNLVKQQIRIAAGKRLAGVPSPRTHPFEFHIICEDPASGMIPFTDTVSRLCWPLDHGARIGSGINEGDIITSGSDPMLTKLVVTAPTCKAVVACSHRALAELEIKGVATPASVCSAVISLDKFSPAPPSTRWFEDVVLPRLVDPAEASSLGATPVSSVGVTPISTAAEERVTFVVELDGRRMELIISCTMFATTVGTPRHRGSQPLRGGAHTRNDAKSGELVDPTGMVNFQIQAVIVRVCIDSGQRVSRGDLLIVLKFMKMEGCIHAPYDDRVTDIAIEADQNVSAYQPLVRVVRNEDETTEEK